MRDEGRLQQEMLLYASPDDLAPADHPLRPIQAMGAEALRRMG